MNQKDTIKMTVVDVDLAVDSNNDGYIWSDDNEIEDNSGTLGYLMCKNDDHDNGNQGLPDCDDEVLANYVDVFDDCGIMELSLMPSGLPSGSVVELSVNDNSKVRIFRYTDSYPINLFNSSGWDAIIGPLSGSSWTRTLSAAPYPSLEYFLIEGVNPGLVEITVIYKIPNGSGGFFEVSRDKVRTTIVKVEFEENAPCAGFDPTLDPHWLMVPLQAGGNNKANAEIALAAMAGNIDFESAAVATATVAPATASGSPEIVTVSSVAEGETEVHAKVGNVVVAILGVDVCKKITKTIKIHAITEENDDVQAIPVGKGKPNQVAISAGANSTLDSTPEGDDQVAGTTITTGADGICNTTVSGDDVQAIAVGNGKANENCVTAGTNASRDTKTIGDDTVVGGNITTGPDGICNTSANATDVSPVNVPSDAALQAYLNDTAWGKQANVHFTVTRSDSTVNFDLDLDGMLDDPYETPTGGIKNPSNLSGLNIY